MGLEKLEKLAKAAKPGRILFHEMEQERTGGMWLTFACDDASAVKRFIEAANPTAVLELIARLRAAERVCDVIRRDHTVNEKHHALDAWRAAKEGTGMSIAQRVQCLIRFADGAWHFFVGDVSFPNGIIKVTEDGKFKAQVLRSVGPGRWLSASRYDPMVPFETLDEARKALINEILEARE